MNFSLPDDFEEVKLEDDDVSFCETEKVVLRDAANSADAVKSIVENCSCDCHDSNPNPQGKIIDHCISCGLRVGGLLFCFFPSIRSTAKKIWGHPRQTA